MTIKKLEKELSQLKKVEEEKQRERFLKSEIRKRKYSALRPLYKIFWAIGDIFFKFLKKLGGGLGKIEWTNTKPSKFSEGAFNEGNYIDEEIVHGRQMYQKPKVSEFKPYFESGINKDEFELSGDL